MFAFLKRYRNWLIVAAVPLLAVAWWLGSPLFLDSTVDEDFPMSSGAEVPAGMTQEQVERQMDEAASQPDVPGAEPMPAETAPLVEVTGVFQGADDFHQGSGRATVYQLEDGSNLLRLEALEVTNGPDLHVLLVPDHDPGSRDDLTGYVDLGSLKGNIGNQNYPIPPDVDVTGFGSVVIYCEPFHVVFATARLTQP